MTSSNVAKLVWIDDLQDYVIEPHEEQETSPEFSFLNVDVDASHDTIVIEDNRYKLFEAFFENFDSEIYSFDLRHKDINNFYLLSEKLLNNFHKLIVNLTSDYYRDELDKTVTIAINYVVNKLRERSSSAKRKRIVQKMPNFVKPISAPIGIKWTSTLQSGRSIVTHKLTQTSMQIIPIKDTLQTLWLNKDFREMYFKYQSCKHGCIEGSFEDFCCGKIFKEHDIFNEPNTLQIQLGCDEFEVCDPLNSKAGQHKVFGVYFEIRNIPAYCRTKQNNIFAVALVKVPDVKEDASCSFDDVWQPIVNELKELETTGFDIGSGEKLKAVLVNVCCDNLGANGLYGFAESFSCRFYCRFCELSKSDCKKAWQISSAFDRNMDKYMKCVSQTNGDKTDFQVTKGVKKYCILNDLKYFKIFPNTTIDVMHDVLEGVAAFFMQLFFAEILKQKILSLEEIQAKIRDFNYGILNKSYKPTNVVIKKHNLGQNAKQIQSILTRLPFIFYEYRVQLNTFWTPLINLLKITRIVTSPKILADDISELKVCIENYLSFKCNDLKVDLKPKDHNLLHYPNSIINMGPPIHGWMMRVESKHKVFTDMIKRTNNFKNITKTMAWNHQEKLCMSKNTFVSDRKLSKRSYKLAKTPDYERYKSKLSPTDVDLFGHIFLIIDSTQYRPGLMVKFKDQMFEIMHIISIKGEISLLCHPYLPSGYKLTLNSVEVQRHTDDNSCILMNIDSLDCNKTFEKIILDGKIYVYADTSIVLSILG